MSRLTRREMKRDEVREGLGHVVDYVRDHGRELVLAIAAVAMLAAATGGWMLYRGQRLQAANNELAHAILLYQAPIDAVAPQPEDPTAPSFAGESERDEAARAAFERVRERFGGGRVGAVAAAYLAEMATRAGDLATARELWTEAERTRNSALTTEMLLNRLAADRAEGRAEEALAELQAMLDGGSDRLPTDVVLDQMATTLESLGREDEALEIYQRIVDEFPQSAYSLRARDRTSAP